MEERDKLLEQLTDDYSAVLKEAKSMGCNEIKALYNIPLKNMELIVQALEKQIPKKVKYEDVGYDQYNNVNVYACICPSCDLEIIKFNDNDVSDKCKSSDIEKMFHSDMVHHAYIGLNNYCSRCSQRLDWSVESEEQ